VLKKIDLKVENRGLPEKKKGSVKEPVGKPKPLQLTPAGKRTKKEETKNVFKNLLPKVKTAHTCCRNNTKGVQKTALEHRRNSCQEKKTREKKFRGRTDEKKTIASGPSIKKRVQSQWGEPRRTTTGRGRKARTTRK